VTRHLTGERRLRAVRDKDTRKVIRNALDAGWEWVRKASGIDPRAKATSRPTVAGETEEDPCTTRQ
jgi:hypothetical protein